MACIACALISTSCAKHSAAAPVPGTINSFDAYAARTIGDAQAAIVGAKTWELCSDAQFPLTVSFDNYTNSCDHTAGPFPASGRPILLHAEQSYNLALDAAKTYHAGASADTALLTQALTQLGIDIGNLLAGIGKGH